MDSELFGPPYLIVIAGPNGAGKSTSARALLRDTLHLLDYVNADAIAQGLSGFRPDLAATAAGRVAIERLRLVAVGRGSEVTRVYDEEAWDTACVRRQHE